MDINAFLKQVREAVTKQSQQYVTAQQTARQASLLAPTQPPLLRTLMTQAQPQIEQYTNPATFDFINTILGMVGGSKLEPQEQQYYKNVQTGQLTPQDVIMGKQLGEQEMVKVGLMSSAPKGMTGAEAKAYQVKPPPGSFPEGWKGKPTPPSSGGEIGKGIDLSRSKTTNEFGFQGQGLKEITTELPLEDIPKRSITTPEYREYDVNIKAGRKVTKPIIATVKDINDPNSPIEIVDGWHRWRQAQLNGDKTILVKYIFKPAGEIGKGVKAATAKLLDDLKKIDLTGK